MSRGLGKVQRRIIDYLEAVDPETTTVNAGAWAGIPRDGRGYVTVHDLAAAINNAETPTRAQIESVRRAVHGLVGRGLVSLTWANVQVRSTSTSQLAARSINSSETELS